MTQELIDCGYLRPLPHGEYEINLQYDLNTIVLIDKKVSLISAPDNDLMTSYREAAYILQDEYNLFPEASLQYKYDDEIYLDLQRKEYKSFLRDQHAKSFSYAAMMLRSDNPQEFAKNALLAWKEGLSASNGGTDNISNASFPVMAATLKKCLEICNSGKSKDFFKDDGRLDDKKLSLLCQDMVYQNAYSPRKFQTSLRKNLFDKNKQFDYLYEQANQKLLKCMAILTPEADEYWNVKEMQQQLFNNNKAVIEKVMEMPFEHFLRSRDRLETMKKMGQPITQKYLDESLLNSLHAEETQKLIEAGVELPETLNTLLSPENIEEIKLFAKDLQQKKKQSMQQNIDRVKNLLSTKINQSSENSTAQPAPTAPKKYTSSDLDLMQLSYSRGQSVIR